MLPIFVTIHDGVIDSLEVCDGSEQLTEKFTAACRQLEHEPKEDELDDGYAHLGDTTLCMSWATLPGAGLVYRRDGLAFEVSLWQNATGGEVHARFPGGDAQAVIDIYGPNPQVQCLVFEPDNEQAAVIVRYDQQGRVEEIVVREDLQDKLVDAQARTDWHRRQYREIS